MAGSLVRSSWAIKEKEHLAREILVLPAPVWLDSREQLLGRNVLTGVGI